MKKTNFSKIIILSSITLLLGLIVLQKFFKSSHHQKEASMIYGIEMVTASISSVYWREESLKEVVSALLPQVDTFNVFLQGYTSVPSFLHNPKITVVRGEDYPAVCALGSNAKFFWADKVRGYHFIVDDDIRYPDNYVTYCIQKIEQYHRTAVVGFHGIFLKDEMKDYFKERTFVNFRKEVKHDMPVHILGTGALAYHTDTIKIKFDDFVIKNEDAIYFAISAQKQHVPLMCVQRPYYYLKPIEPTCYDSRCVYEQSLRDGGKTRLSLIQTHGPWKLYGEAQHA